MKFKRILKLLLADFFLRNDLFFAHTNPIGLLSNSAFLAHQTVLRKDLTDGVERHFAHKQAREDLIRMN